MSFGYVSANASHSNIGEQGVKCDQAGVSFNHFLLSLNCDFARLAVLRFSICIFSVFFPSELVSRLRSFEMRVITMGTPPDLPADLKSRPIISLILRKTKIGVAPFKFYL